VEPCREFRAPALTYTGRGIHEGVQNRASTLTVFAEILNLTDTKNVIAVYSDTGEPDQTTIGTHSDDWVRDPSNYGAPRRIRLGMGIRF
jgi:hypothetical protein